MVIDTQVEMTIGRMEKLDRLLIKIFLCIVFALRYSINMLLKTENENARAFDQFARILVECLVG